VTGRSPRRRLARIAVRRRHRQRWPSSWWRAVAGGIGRRRRTARAAAFLTAAVLGWLTGGPVAAFVLGTYATLAAAALQARLLRRRDDLARAGAIEAVGALAAELRAGCRTETALAVSAVVTPGDRQTPAAAEATRRVAAAVVVSERLGAPLADLLDRVDADLRASHLLRKLIAAQTAGSQATTLLLAALPLAGLALGSAMGADPLRQLLHTPLGAACSITALALQTAGLLWVSRLLRFAVEVA